jgi:hypothetical protein
VVHTVPDEVHQRIIQLINHRLIQLCIRAVNRQFDLFAKVVREVVDKPAKSFESGSYR